MGVELAQRLKEFIPDEREFFSMPEKNLKQIIGGRSRIHTTAYRNSRLIKAEKELKFLETKSIKSIYYTDSCYPQRLLEACDAPLMLYTLGNCDFNTKHVISMVGTRHCTSYGQRMCDDLVKQLKDSLKDIVIISGLAYGIDIASHRACLRHDVPTIAVMAKGLNSIYPAEHRNDAIAILNSHGAVLTEYLSSDEITKGNFLARNRIIAGMADCTVIIESASSGGSLVTASLANSYNRDVFAVPGRVGDEFSKGCNGLIRHNKAMSITCADDIIDAMRWENLQSSNPPQQIELFPTLSAEEQKIVDFLKMEGDSHINTISSKLNMPVYRVLSTLMELDCKGVVITMPGSRYAIH